MSVEKQIFITNKCQQQCAYCQVAKSDWVIDIKSLISSIQKFIDNHATENQINIHLFGGEPLMVKEEILEPLFKHYFPPQVYFYIATNGILLNEENYKFLKQHNIRILLSIDGPKEIHNINRKNFDLIYNQILQVLNGDRLYGIQATFNNDTIDRFYEAYLFFKTFPAQYINFNINKLDQYTYEQEEHLISVLDKIYQEDFIMDEFTHKISFKEDPNKYFGIFQSFDEPEDTSMIVSSQGTVIQNRIFLLSGLQEETKSDGFYNDNCFKCPMQKRCHSNTVSQDNLLKVHNGICIELILKYYQPNIILAEENPLENYYTNAIPIAKKNDIDYLYALAKIASINERILASHQIQNHKISLNSKYVYEDSDYVYKVQDPQQPKIRIAIQQQAKRMKAPILQEEEIVEENNLYIISRQQKLKLIHQSTTEYFSEDFFKLLLSSYTAEEIKNIQIFLEKYHIGFGGFTDIGFDQNNKIKIFSFKTTYILNKNGDLIC